MNRLTISSDPKSHTQLVARQAWLCHHQFRGAGNELIAKMDGVFL
jgi:hypothetical protein